jgi:hypothetical protein
MEEIQQDHSESTSWWGHLKVQQNIKDCLKTFFYGLVIMVDIMLESLVLMAIGGFMVFLGFLIFITTPIWTIWLFFTWIPTLITVLV